MLDFDFLRADRQDPIVALAGIANVYHDSPIAEVPLLCRMQVAADMYPGHDGVKCIQKTPLAAVPAAGNGICEADGAPVGKQDVHTSACDQRCLMGNIFVGNVIGLSV